MTVNEIRIGSKVLVNGLHGENVIMTVAAIIGKGSFGDEKRVILFKEDNEQLGEFLMHCEGVPITKERLLLNGFEVSYSSKFRLKFDHKKYNEIGYDFSHTAEKSMEGFRYYGQYIKLKYMHQVQNLFFDLKGEELTDTSPS